MEKEKQEKVGFFKKWYTYQKERFPVMVFFFYVLCIVIGTFVVMSFCSGNGSIGISTSKNAGGYLARNLIIFENSIIDINTDSFITILVMLICGFLQFLMVRIVDEFKDYEEDCKYRPYRPVPRGLISLNELKGLFAFCFILQILLTFFFKGDFIALAVLWIIFFLMTKSFFIKKILEKHLILEIILDELMMPCMIIYLASFVVKQNMIWQLLFNGRYFLQNTGLQNNVFKNINNIEISDAICEKILFVFIGFLLLSYFCSCIAEVSRKIRSKDKEEKGVKTYTAVFGIPKAILLLCVLEICAFVCQYVVLGTERYVILFGVLIIPLLCNISFCLKPEHKYSKLVELGGNMYVAFSYLCMIMLYSGFGIIN